MNDKKTGIMNIWDVLFSLDSSHFPIQRNYFQEPRGSTNPVNSQVTEKVCSKTVDYIRENIADPNELYVLDFEHNYAIRKLADFLLYVDLKEFRSWGWDDSQYPPLENMVSILKRLYRWSDDIIFFDELDHEIIGLTDKRDEIDIRQWRDSGHESMVDVSRFQQAVQYVIENSDYDWKTKAEAFLRASSERGYSPADDETIIYLISQSLNDEQLKEEAQHRWDRYKKEWGELFFVEENPFKDRFSIDRLRLINWDKLSSLRPFEPLLIKPSAVKKIRSNNSIKYQEKLLSCRRTYDYKVESQHLLSPSFISDYVKVFSLFRTDLDVDPVRSHLKTLIGKFYSYISGSRDFEYNYTVTDIAYLSDLLFSFTTNRFQHDILGKQDGSIFSNVTRDNIDISFDNSTVKFSNNIPMITLIALEVHTVFYSRSKGMMAFLKKAKEWLLNNQSPYGFWYDGVNNPEYTTVLVLDALKLIKGEEGVSFPIKTRPSYNDDEISSQNHPVLIIDYISKTIQYGTTKYRPKIKGGKSQTWDFINHLINAKATGMAVPRYLNLPYQKDDNVDSDGPDYHRIDWKNAFDIISRNIGGNEILNNFISYNCESYTFNDNVTIVNNSTVMERSNSRYLDTL